MEKYQENVKASMWKNNEKSEYILNYVTFNIS